MATLEQNYLHAKILIIALHSTSEENKKDAADLLDALNVPKKLVLNAYKAYQERIRTRDIYLDNTLEYKVVKDEDGVEQKVYFHVEYNNARVAFFQSVEPIAKHLTKSK